MNSSFESVADCGNFRNLVFFDVSLGPLTKLFVYVSDHVGDFALQKFFRPEIFMVNLVNDLKTISFLVIRT